MAPDRWHIPTTDEEIVGVFIEEATDLVDNIDTHLTALRRNPADKKALTEIRRSFHTLKGSGRMVKALDLSEVAWKVEKALNYTIASNAPISEALLRLVATARVQLPRLVDAFGHRRSLSGTGEIERLVKLADELAAGKAHKAATVAPVPAMLRTSGVSNFERRLNQCMQRADEALHRSEMALQQARHTSAMGKATNPGAGQRDCLAEVDRLGNLVQALSNEVANLRGISDRPQKGSILERSDLNRLVDERMRTRFTPSMARLRNEVERNIEDNYRTLMVWHRFGWPALFLSAVIGALIAIGLLLSLQPDGQTQSLGGGVGENAGASPTTIRSPLLAQGHGFVMSSMLS